jgi:hypothetical protein
MFLAPQRRMSPGASDTCRDDGPSDHALIMDAPQLWIFTEQTWTIGRESAGVGELYRLVALLSCCVSWEKEVQSLGLNQAARHGAVRHGQLVRYDVRGRTRGRGSRE